MDAKCMFCGRKEEIDEDHPDYEKIRRKGSEHISYICLLCKAKLEYEAREGQKGTKPI